MLSPKFKQLFLWKSNRVFSPKWPASMKIYWNKRKRLHKKRVQLPQDWFGTQIWPPSRHVKALYKGFMIFQSQKVHAHKLPLSIPEIKFGHATVKLP